MDIKIFVEPLQQSRLGAVPTNVLLGCRITSWNGIRCFGQGGNWSRKVYGSTRVFLVNVTSNRCPIFLNSRSPQFGPKTTSFKMYLHPCWSSVSNRWTLLPYEIASILEPYRVTQYRRSERDNYA